MDYVGAIDDTANGRVSGWAVTRFGDACSVRVTVNGGTDFTMASTLPRPDLAAKQQARGAGGFRIDVASALRPGHNCIDVLFHDGTPLPGSPVSLAMPADWVAPAAPRPALKLAAAVPRLTLAELEEISLDDVAHAVAHGMIRIAAPRPLPVSIAVAAPAPAVPPASVSTPPAGWFARLRRRSAVQPSA